MQIKNKQIPNPLQNLNNKFKKICQLNGEKIFLKISTFPDNLNQDKETNFLFKLMKDRGHIPRKYITQEDYKNGYMITGSEFKDNKFTAHSDSYKNRMIAQKRGDTNYTNFALYNEKGDCIGVMIGRVFPNTNNNDKDGIGFDNIWIDEKYKNQKLSTILESSIFDLYFKETGKIPNAFATFGQQSIKEDKDKEFISKIKFFFGGNIDILNEKSGEFLKIEACMNKAIEKNEFEEIINKTYKAFDNMIIAETEEWKDFNNFVAEKETKAMNKETLSNKFQIWK